VGTTGREAQGVGDKPTNIKTLAKRKSRSKGGKK